MEYPATVKAEVTPLVSDCSHGCSHAADVKGDVKFEDQLLLNTFADLDFKAIAQDAAINQSFLLDDPSAVDFTMAEPGDDGSRLAQTHGLTYTQSTLVISEHRQLPGDWMAFSTNTPNQQQAIE